MQHCAIHFNICWGNSEWRSAAVSTDADGELNFLNWNECCEQTTILHTVHKKWGNFVHEGLGGENNSKENDKKSALMLASHITYNNEQRENCKNIRRVPLQFIA